MAPIDIVIANAGAAESAPAGKIDAAHWERMIGVNLTGAFLTVKAALSDVTRKRAGCQWRRPHRVRRLDGRPEGLSLCRGLLRGKAWRCWSRCARSASELARAPSHGQRRMSRLHRYAVARTPSPTSSQRPAARKTRHAQNSRAHNPQGRFVTPEEVAQTVLWLCLPASRAITGQAISVSGGEI